MKIRKDTVLSIIAGVGVVATAVTAIFGTKRYLEKLNALDMEKVHEASKKEKAINAAVSFAPLALATGGTIFCIAKANKSATKVIAGLSATAGYLATNRDRLKEALKNSTGETVLPCDMPYLQKGSIEATGNGNLLCFEGYSGRQFYSSEEAVREAVGRFQSRFLEEGEYLSLNDLYEELEISTSHFGHQFGWAANSDYYDTNIDIEVTRLDDYIKPDGTRAGEPCLVIDIYTYPMEGWREV